MDQRFNINGQVRVRLNSIGLDVFREEAEGVRARLSDALKEKVATEPELDDAGYWRAPLWRVMQLFGPYLLMGGTPPFDTEIILELPEDDGAAP